MNTFLIIFGTIGITGLLFAIYLDYKAVRSFECMFFRHIEFSEDKFKGSTWLSSLQGLSREILEVQEAMENYQDKEHLAEEYVDCIMYTLDSMNRAGITQQEFKAAFKKKLDKNRNRQWKQNADNSYSHIK